VRASRLMSYDAGLATVRVDCFGVQPYRLGPKRPEMRIRMDFTRTASFAMLDTTTGRW